MKNIFKVLMNYVVMVVVVFATMFLTGCKGSKKAPDGFKDAKMQQDSDQKNFRRMLDD